MKWRDIRQRNFACGHVPCVCNIGAGSYVDKGHRSEEKSFKTLQLARVHFAAASSKAATPNACDPDRAAQRRDVTVNNSLSLIWFVRTTKRFR